MSQEINKISEAFKGFAEIVENALNAIRKAVARAAVAIRKFAKQFFDKINRLKAMYSVPKYHCDIRLLKARHTYKEKIQKK